MAGGQGLPSTLILEVPQRHNGGRCTSLSDLLEMRALCDQHGVRSMSARLSFYCNPLSLYTDGVSVGMERERQQNDSLADG